MPTDNASLRQTLQACMPSLVIDSVAKESGQRVVYFAHFDDSLIPTDLPPEVEYLKGWGSWGNVVAKVVSGIDANSLIYLQREIELLKEIDSSHFPKLLFSDLFNENPLTDEHLFDKLFITIEERVTSQPLSAIFHHYNSEASVANLLIKLCEALNILWLHKKKLVHRDLKPDNILIRTGGEVVIIDLGIVRETGATGITQTAFPWGPMSLHYAAPEQTTNDKYAICYKTDFFALGIIGYELLAGVNPFKPTPTTTANEIYMNIQNLAPPTLHSLGRASPDFSNIIEQMLEKQPYKRFRTPSQLIDALTKIARPA